MLTGKKRLAPSGKCPILPLQQPWCQNRMPAKEGWHFGLPSRRPALRKASGPNGRTETVRRTVKRAKSSHAAFPVLLAFARALQAHVYERCLDVGFPTTEVQSSVVRMFSFLFFLLSFFFSFLSFLFFSNLLCFTFYLYLFLVFAVCLVSFFFLILLISFSFLFFLFLFVLHFIFVFLFCFM
jgi:hypothetical protein